MSTEKPVAKKRAYKKKATSKATIKIKSTGAPTKAIAIPVQKTVITIAAPDGVITISKIEEIISEQVLSKGELVAYLKKFSYATVARNLFLILDFFFGKGIKFFLSPILILNVLL